MKDTLIYDGQYTDYSTGKPVKKSGLNMVWERQDGKRFIGNCCPDAANYEYAQKRLNPDNDLFPQRDFRCDCGRLLCKIDINTKISGVYIKCKCQRVVEVTNN